MSVNKRFFKKPFLKRAGLLLLLAALFYFPLFLHLDSKPLREWDEARNAINAFEMTKTGELLVKTFHFEPDLWETKPPLLVWLQAAGFKLLGYGELAVRLPSAFALIFLSFFWVYWFRKHLKGVTAGITAALILISSDGILHDHAGRTGDHDAMLLCFTGIMLLSFFAYSEKKETRSILLFAVSLILGIYTKSIAALMLMPGILLYLLLSRKLPAMLKDRRIYMAIAAVIAVVGLYYTARELRGPGYLEAVWHNELFPRYSNSSDRYQYNVSAYWYYFNELKDWQFKHWRILLLLSLIWNFIVLKGIQYRLNLFLVCNAVCFFFVISSGTSNYWYDLPLIPMFACIIGLALHSTLLMLRRKLPALSPGVFRIMYCFALVALFYMPYKSAIEKVTSKQEHNQQVAYGYAFRSLENRHPEIKHLMVYDPLGYNYPLVFYTLLYTEKGYRIQNIGPEDQIPNGTVLLMLDEKYAHFQSRNIPHKDIETGLMYRVIMTE